MESQISDLTELPYELLLEIFDKIADPYDLLQLKIVCKKWRHILLPMLRDRKKHYFRRANHPISMFRDPSHLCNFYTRLTKFLDVTGRQINKNYKNTTMESLIKYFPNDTNKLGISTKFAATITANITVLMTKYSDFPIDSLEQIFDNFVEKTNSTDQDSILQCLFMDGSNPKTNVSPEFLLKKLIFIWICLCSDDQPK